MRWIPCSLKSLKDHLTGLCTIPGTMYLQTANMKIFEAQAAATFVGLTATPYSAIRSSFLLCPKCRHLVFLFSTVFCNEIQHRLNSDCMLLPSYFFFRSKNDTVMVVLVSFLMSFPTSSIAVHRRFYNLHLIGASSLDGRLEIG